MVEFRVKYDLGEKETWVNIPREAVKSVVKPNPVEKVDLEEAIAGKLGRMLEGKERVVALCDDYTRPTPARYILRVIEKVFDGELEVIMACGTHEKPKDPSLMERKFGEFLNRVIVHNAYRIEEHSFVGVTKFGTPVWVNKRVLTGFTLGVGWVVPEVDLGFTGGGTIILPGVSFLETINRHHSFFIAPQATYSVVENNISRLDIDEAADLAGLGGIVNVVPHPDGGVAAAVVGNHRSYLKLAETAVKTYRVEKPGKADLTIVAPGLTMDASFIQASKALFTASEITKPGGIIIMVAECRAGFLWPELLDAYRKAVRDGDKPEDLLLKVVKREGEIVSLVWLYKLYDVFLRKKWRVKWFSKHLGGEVEEMGFERIDSLDKIVDRVVNRGGKVNIVTHGALVFFRE